jgi:transcriptional regulator GlxA family with amidase domain
MCPACIGTAALIAGGATSSGGLAALVIKKFCAKNFARKIGRQFRFKESHDGQQQDRSTTA